MTTKSTITTRSMKSSNSQPSGPTKNPVISGIFDSTSREFFLGDYSHLPKNSAILSGHLDPIERIFYPDSPTLEPVGKVINNMRKYKALSPHSSPPESPRNSSTIQSTSDTSPLNTAIQKKIVHFKATHLLVGRLKSLSKQDLIQDLDALTSTFGIQYDRSEFSTSFDRKQFQLFSHSDPIRFHCLLTLLSPVNVSSAPDGTTKQDKALPVFSFSYKANPPHFMRGTSSRLTLQFLKDVSYGKLHSMEEGLVLRGGFSEDPCLCSLLLHYLPQQLIAAENLNISPDLIIPIFESRDLTTRDPNKNQRLFREELYLVLRTAPLSLPSLTPVSLNASTSLYFSPSLSGWTGLVALSISKFESTSTSGTALIVPYCSIQLPCSSENTLFIALTTAQNMGIDLSALKLAYISRGYLQIPSRRSKPDSLVMIFETDDTSTVAGWSVPSQDPPLFEDIPNMHPTRRLYELDAGINIPPLPPRAARPPPSVNSSNDKWYRAALRNLKAQTSKRLKTQDKKIAELELKIVTLIASMAPPIATTTTLDNSQVKPKKKKKKKTAAAATTEESGGNEL